MGDTKGEDCGINPIQFRGWVKEACRAHDKFYQEGSWAQKNLSRKEADRRFLLMMLELSGNNILKKAASYVMYGFTRVLGAVFWEGKE